MLWLWRGAANVIIAGRNPTKGEAAVVQIRQSVPNATIRFEMLDLANLQSVEDFGARLRADRGRLDPASSTTLP